MRKFATCVLVAAIASFGFSRLTSGATINNPSTGFGTSSWPLVAPTGLGAVPQFKGPSDQPTVLSANTGSLDVILESGSASVPRVFASKTATKLGAFWGIWEKSVSNNSATSIVTFNLGGTVGACGQIQYSIYVNNLTDYQVETGLVNFAYASKAGVVTAGTMTKSGNVQAVSAGTLTVTFANSTGANTASIQVTINSSLASLTQEAITFSLIHPGQSNITWN